MGRGIHFADDTTSIFHIKNGMKLYFCSSQDNATDAGTWDIFFLNFFTSKTTWCSQTHKVILKCYLLHFFKTLAIQSSIGGIVHNDDNVMACDILKVKVTTARSKVKSRSHHGITHLHTKHQLHAHHPFLDIDVSISSYLFIFPDKLEYLWDIFFCDN